jgi:hypothetical protein
VPRSWCCLLRLPAMRTCFERSLSVVLDHVITVTRSRLYLTSRYLILVYFLTDCVCFLSLWGDFVLCLLFEVIGPSIKAYETVETMEAWVGKSCVVGVNEDCSRSMPTAIDAGLLFTGQCVGQAVLIVSFTSLLCRGCEMLRGTSFNQAISLLKLYLLIRYGGVRRRRYDASPSLVKRYAQVHQRQPYTQL